jgi:uncharacterized protein YhaN
MRITRLDLLKYGAFEGRSMVLRPDAKLHVILGANEAGKSSTLAAVSDLLFGFPSRTPYDFRFKAAELRLGGEVASSAGGKLAFVRRKGTKNTLLDLTDKPLDDHALAPYLGQMTREVFAKAFGLDAERLREGAEALLQARGEVGSSLMAAASGIRGLTRLRRDIEDRAEGIFTPNKSQSRAFYQARDRYEGAKKAIGENELRASGWKRLNEAVARNEELLAALTQEGRKRAMERARVERLKRLAPLLRKIETQEQALADQADLPAAPPGYPARLGEALEGAAKAQEIHSKAEAERAEAQALLAEISVEAALIERAGEIEALVQRIGEVLQYERELPGVDRDRDAASADLDSKARALGLTSGELLEQRQPTAGDLALLRDLTDEGRRLVERRANFEESRNKELEGLADIDALNQTRVHLTDPAPLREQWHALDVLKAAATHEQKATNLRREEEALRDDALRLKPPVSDLSRLASTPLPTTEVLAAFTNRFDGVQTLLRDADREIADVETRIKTLRTSLDALAAGGDVPTPDLIAASRSARDVEWALLRATLFGEANALSGSALAASVTRFERANENADRLSDSAVRDASRVADFAAKTKELTSEAKNLVKVQAKRAAHIAAGDAIESAWGALWSPVGVAPLSHRDMEIWRKNLDDLIRRYVRQSEMRHEVRRAEEELADLSAPLCALVKACGLAEIEGLDVTRQGHRVEARLQELTKAWDESRTQARIREEIARRIAKLDGELTSLCAGQADWAERWKAALPKAGLSPDATIVEALAALDIWKLAPASIEKRNSLARRVNGMRRNRTQFEDDARALLAALSPDLATLAPTLGVERLNERLAAARRAEARREEIDRRMSACEATLRKAQSALAEARGKLDELAATLPPCDDLSALQARLARRDALAAALADLRAQFADQADGHGEAQVRAELGGFDPDRAQADLAALQQEDERSTRESNEAYAALKDARRQIEDWTSGLGSEAASQQRVNAEAEMQEAGRSWLVLRLAGAMLEEALERHRATRQDPLMGRASALFAALTGGAFSGVGQSYGEDGVEALFGKRANGEDVAIAGLSEGTRDQLYLALRLAYVEDYAARAEPTPFIADDLFTSFDDARTAHGLRALADVGASAQCVLFTHHRHVAEIAQAVLGADLDLSEI